MFEDCAAVDASDLVSSFFHAIDKFYNRFNHAFYFKFDCLLGKTKGHLNRLPFFKSERGSLESSISDVDFTLLFNPRMVFSFLHFWHHSYICCHYIYSIRGNKLNFRLVAMMKCWKPIHVCIIVQIGKFQMPQTECNFTSQNSLSSLKIVAWKPFLHLARIFLFLTFVMDHSWYAVPFVSCPECLEHPIKNTQHFTTCIPAKNADNTTFSNEKVGGI